MSSCSQVLIENRGLDYSTIVISPRSCSHHPCIYCTILLRSISKFESRLLKHSHKSSSFILVSPYELGIGMAIDTSIWWMARVTIPLLPPKYYLLYHGNWITFRMHLTICTFFHCSSCWPPLPYSVKCHYFSYNFLNFILEIQVCSLLGPQVSYYFYWGKGRSISLIVCWGGLVCFWLVGLGEFDTSNSSFDVDMHYHLLITLELVPLIEKVSVALEDVEYFYSSSILPKLNISFTISSSSSEYSTNLNPSSHTQILGGSSLGLVRLRTLDYSFWRSKGGLWGIKKGGGLLSMFGSRCIPKLLVDKLGLGIWWWIGQMHWASMMEKSIRILINPWWSEVALPFFRILVSMDWKRKKGKLILLTP